MNGKAYPSPGCAWCGAAARLFTASISKSRRGASPRFSEPMAPARAVWCSAACGRAADAFRRGVRRRRIDNGTATGESAPQGRRRRAGGSSRAHGFDGGRELERGGLSSGHAASATAGIEAALETFPELRAKLASRADRFRAVSSKCWYWRRLLSIAHVICSPDELSFGLAPVVVARVVPVVAQAR